MKEEKSWEKEFSEKFNYFLTRWTDVIIGTEKFDLLENREDIKEFIKSFIRQLLAQREKEVLEMAKQACGNPPPCLDILIDGKTMEESQHYIQGAEEMMKNDKR